MRRSKRAAVSRRATGATCRAVRGCPRRSRPFSRCDIMDGRPHPYGWNPKNLRPKTIIHPRTPSPSTFSKDWRSTSGRPSRRSSRSEQEVERTTSRRGPQVLWTGRRPPRSWRGPRLPRMEGREQKFQKKSQQERRWRRGPFRPLWKNQKKCQHCPLTKFREEKTRGARRKIVSPSGRGASGSRGPPSGRGARRKIVCLCTRAGSFSRRPGRNNSSSANCYKVMFEKSSLV